MKIHHIGFVCRENDINKFFFSPKKKFIYVIIIFPLVMTLSEAFAPPTWATPFLFLFGYSTIYLIKIIKF